jgi:hypothetical protein
VAGLPLPPSAEPASAARPGPSNTVPASTNGASSPAQPFNLAYRTKPPQPMIKHLDFAFQAPVPVTQGVGRERHAIRLHNLRGVVTHALIIGAVTSEVEITAILSSDALGPINGGTSPNATPVAAPTIPDVRLRVNGSPGSMARYVYAESELGEEPVPDTADGPKGTPVGVRWIIPISRGRLETRIDVVCIVAGRTEQCGIYVNRQF